MTDLSGSLIWQWCIFFRCRQILQCVEFILLKNIASEMEDKATIRSRMEFPAGFKLNLF